MDQPRHKNIVAIIWRNKGKACRGSGALISKDLVLTSAHNFYYQNQQVPNELFEIYPGLCGKLGKHFKIDKVFIPEEYSKSKKNESKYDYALVKLT